jgi:hypothetical protein
MEEKLLKTLKMEHKTLQDQINELNKQMREKSKDLMKEAFREFFAKYDEIVKNVYWTQYTPYFNDGEVCEFSVNDAFILLKGIDEDEEECDEGSSTYSKEDIKELKKKIAEIGAWERDPMAAARRHQSEYIKRYNRNPFDTSRAYRSIGSYGNYQTKTEEELMREWKPHYSTKEAYQEELRRAEFLISKYPNLQKDFYEIQSMIRGLDENLMEAMFGNHVKVIVSSNGIEIEEYEHD